jgi:hypothetical protein
LKARFRSGLVLSTLLALVACGKLKPAGDATGAAGSGGAGSNGNDGAAGTSVSDGAADLPSNDGAGGNTDAHAQADCGAVLLYPPIIEVQDAVTGAPICDPTFTVGSADGGVVEMGHLCGSNEANDFGCPAPPTDGGAAPCTFTLGVGGSQESLNVQVSKSGYETAVVAVMGGRGGCVPYVPASHSVVKLHALVDASADGG